MALEQSLRSTLKQSIELSQQLTLEQRHLLCSHLLGLQLELIQALREENYQPEGSCPSCRHVLTPLSIIQGFRDDVNDFTTKCPVCKVRFEPKLICRDTTGYVALQFYCGVQTLDQLLGLHTLAPADILSKHPSIYRSALVHFGGVRTAFARLGLQYQFEEVPMWQVKVRTFLGRMSDRRIADAAGVKASEVRDLRKSFDIPEYRVKRALEEAEAA